MTQPVMKVELFPENRAIEINTLYQLSSYSMVFGNNTILKIGQTFRQISDFDVRSVIIKLKRIGTLTDNVVCKIYQSDKSTLIATSAQVAGSQVNTSFKQTIFDFATPVTLVKNNIYFIEFSRTGSQSASNYYIADGNAGPSIYVDGQFWQYIGSTWDGPSGSDDYDMLLAVHSATNLIAIDTALVGPNESQILGHTFGTTVRPKVGQTFKALASANFEELTVLLLKFGTPVDNVVCKIWQSDKTTLLGTSEAIAIDSFNYYVYKYIIFKFTTPISLTQNTNYFLSIERTGSVSDTNYMAVLTNSNNPYANGTAWEYTTSWTEFNPSNPYYDFFMEMHMIDTNVVDITNSVLSIRTNRGKNDVDGQLLQGSADLVLDNFDNRFNINNDSSDVYGIFKLIALMRVSVTYASVTYYLFTGYIKTINPSIADKRVVVTLHDLLYLIKDAEISGGSFIDRATAIVVSILYLLKVRYFELDNDDQALSSLVWDNINGLTALNKVIEAGQHHHFIDEKGIYTFKNNQWLNDNTPKYTINYDDSETDNAEVLYEHDKIQNFITINYGASSTRLEQNFVSIGRYGLKARTFDNDLVPDDVTYASLLGQYLLALFSEPEDVYGLDLTLSNKFPIIFDLNFGDVIRFIYEDVQLDGLFTIFGISYTIEKNMYKVTLKCRKWVTPSAIASIVYFEPFVGTSWKALSSDSSHWAQGFKRSADFELHEVRLKLKWDSPHTKNVVVSIYPADGSGLPTGSVIATSNVVAVPTTTGEGTFDFSFPSKPQLTAATDYTFVAYVAKSSGQHIVAANHATLLSGANSVKFAQRIVLPNRGALRFFSMFFNYTSPATGSHWAKAYVYTDSGGNPGTLLTTSQPFNLGNNRNRIDNQILFSGFSPAGISLSAGTVYWLIVERSTQVTWTARGTTNNSYPSGEFVYWNGSAWIFPTNEDMYTDMQFFVYQNKWQVWGLSTNPYADGIASEYKDTVGPWSSLSPWDFYFRMKLLE